MKLICLTIILSYICSCTVVANQASTEPQTIERNDKLRLVDIADGINSEEAEILSSEYFWRYVSGCGYAGKPKADGNFWSSVVYFGYAGTPLQEKIEINKRTGAITMKGYPSVDNPVKEWEDGP